MSEKTRNIARKALDKRFDTFLPVNSYAPPTKGWLRAIRESLGMTRGQLAKRIGISQQTLSKIELSETYDTIRLETLRKTAAALDCTVIYAVVPNERLEERVSKRARAIAKQKLPRVSHTMALEAQDETSRDMDERIESYADALRDKDLWD